ncbi:MAG: hypothetical protein ACE3JK_14080 [Sporolactobacillus sp.]
MDKQLTKQVMNNIEKIINNAQDMLNDKRDTYVMRTVEGKKKYTSIVNREAYLQFIVEWSITQLENLSSEIYDQTGIDCDQPGNQQGS